MSCYRVVVLSADAVERLREKLLFIGMSSGAAMRCWQANSNLKSLLYTKAPSYNTRNDYIFRQIRSFTCPILCHKDFRSLLDLTIFTFFHRSIKGGKQKILDLEGLWIYFPFFADKKKTESFLVLGLGMLFALNIVSTNTTVKVSWKCNLFSLVEILVGMDRSLWPLMRLKLPSWKVFSQTSSWLPHE